MTDELSPLPSHPGHTIFIGGLPRSGTTLVSKVVATHPLITGLTRSPTPHNEGQYLQNVYPRAHGMGVEVLRARSGPFGRGLASGIGRGQNSHWAYHESAHLTELDVPRFPDARNRLLHQWRPYFEKPNAPILVEKSPPNLMKMRWLQEVFPGSTFVTVSRHPIMQALAVMKWGTRRNRVGLGLSQIVHHWFTAMDRYRDDSHHLNQTMIIRFEDFMASPASSLDALSQQLAIDSSAFAVDLMRVQDDPYLPYWRYFAGIDRTAGFSTTIPQNTSTRRLIVPVERVVATILGPSLARRIERQYEARMAEYGYSMRDHIVANAGAPS